MADIWFTSDLHFMHNKEFLYGPRGFSNEREMSETLVENWNSVVKPEDIVYDLGDLALSDVQEAVKYIKKLNGRHFCIIGNHDTNKKIDFIHDYCYENVNFLGYAEVLKYEKYKFFLCHYPTNTSNFDDKKFSQHLISLHGHTHQQKNWIYTDNPFIYHVGVDSHNNTPVHIDEILTDIRNRYNAQEQLYETYKEDNYNATKKG